MHCAPPSIRLDRRGSDRNQVETKRRISNGKNRFFHEQVHTHTRKTTNDDDRRREIKHEIMKIEEEEEEGEKEHRKQRRSMKICSKYMDWNSNGKFILHSIYSNFFSFFVCFVFALFCSFFPLYSIDLTLLYRFVFFFCF